MYTCTVYINLFEQDQLGSGGFGIVHVWQHSGTGQCLALKRCKFGSEVSVWHQSSLK